MWLHITPTHFCLSSHLWQDQFDMVSDADLQSLDTKIVALTAKVQSLQQSCRHMEAGRTGRMPEGAPGTSASPEGRNP